MPCTASKAPTMTASAAGRCNVIAGAMTVTAYLYLGAILLGPLLILFAVGYEIWSILND